VATIETRSEFVRRVFMPVEVDSGLPDWARRSNPIVRRELGIYWRVFTPQIGPIVRWYGIQSAAILLTIPFPPLFAPILMLVIASATLAPLVFATYVRMLADIAVDSVDSITNEIHNDTFTLLRVTPVTMREIILSKVIASIWRRMEAFDTVLIASLFLGTPLIGFAQILLWPADLYPGRAQWMTVIIMAVSMLRLPLEAFMIASMGAAMGAAARTRSIGVIITGALGFFYFLLINLARLLDLPLIGVALVEIVLPLTLPLMLGLFFVRLTERLIEDD